MTFKWHGLSLIPHGTSIDFIRIRHVTYLISILITAITFVMLWINGLNLGIDFKGGILIEVQTKGPANLKELRDHVSHLDLGEVALQEFGRSDEVLIRLARQEGGEQGQIQAISKIQKALGDDVSFRRIETVGPKMGEELINNGIYAVFWCLVAMLIYIWFRFELHFAICAIIALFHDAIAVLALYTIFHFEFNSQAIVAILMTVGYSINDTVVIYDRIRENLRKYKAMPDRELINLSINETLSRTILTSSTTLLSLIALYVFGGEVVAEYSLPLIIGITFGTYSSIFLSAPLLLFFNLRRKNQSAEKIPQKA
ncbi:MAG: protein translocase subunit SecF [Proteobacteria bacterium]|nr:protein translocase subunit SecF [Pseudomonadota bacterium]